MIQPLGKYTKDVNQWDMGELNMGNAQTLADLISWSFQNYPAQYYLSIADHGRGTTGTAWDETSNNDYLTPSELRTALSAVTNFGNRKIDVLHFDACLMGLIEDVYQVKEYANYMVTMENLGWSVFAYDKYIQSAISASGRIASPRELAIHIAAMYHSHAQITNYPHTIAALDLSKTDELMQALNIFSEDVRGVIDSNQKTLQDIRTATQKFDSRDYMDITQKDEYLDLYDLAQRTYQRINNSALRILAQKVMDIISGQFVIAEYRQSAVYQNKYIDLNDSHGVSIYFPQSIDKITGM
ncbi:clostripain-related cysteine peptidase [Kouleothrix sp.]|uniref:clostripain-related cysteine peptidase n=1 Tax=Kouleothrix sp. TaxID=2779161 RepID=UPI00391C419A